MLPVATRVGVAGFYGKQVLAKTYRLTNETLGAWKKNPALVAPEGKDTILFDSTLTGFALRIRPGMAWVWIIQYRNSEGRTRRLRLGRYPALTPAQARELASAKLHEVAGGADPSDQKRLNREAMTVAAMCRAYIKAAETGGAVKRGGSPKKASTLELDKGRIDRHIIPLLGTRKAFNVTDRDVRAFMRDVRDGKTAIDEKTGPRGRAIVKGGPTAASRAVGLLGGIYAWAIKELEIRPDNPCRGVSRPPDGKKDRRLSLEDYAALGTAMDDLAAKGENTNALDMIRLIALTGLRRAEAMNLRLSQVDIKAKCLRLADTKTGA